MADNDWTCYRRNYFSLSCSYTLQPTIPKGAIYLVGKHGGSGAQVHNFAMSIAAGVDGQDGKSIELVQHTPKRDKGPQDAPARITLAPRPPAPHGLYGGDSGLSGSRGSIYDAQGFNQNPNSPQIEATFERIQFKNATDNNEKRRAAQQYYHLFVELFADVGPQHADRWVKIASRMSAPMVVRGRSPGHYQGERRGSNTSTGPGGSGGAGGGCGAYTPGLTPRTPGDITMSGTSSMLLGPGYSGGYDGRGHYYRSNIAPLEIPAEPTLSAEEAKSIQESPDYLFHPGSIYEGHEARYQLPSVSKYTTAKIKPEYGSEGSTSSKPVAGIKGSKDTIMESTQRNTTPRLSTSLSTAAEHISATFKSKSQPSSKIKQESNISSSFDFDCGEQLARIRDAVIAGSTDESSKTISVGQKYDRTLSLTISWDVLGFTRLYIDEGSGGDLASAITLTGSALFAQATTCAAYLKQNWPLTCENVLSVLQAALNKEDRTAKVQYSTLEICIEHFEPTLVSVKGSEDAIVEVVQQLAWIGASFRTSTDDQIEYCEAIVCRSESDTLSPGALTITFENKRLEKEQVACWHSLFCNATIATGFPIPSRGDEIGLEISLEMMAALGGATHAFEFEGGLIVKGHSTAFVPTKKQNDVVQWHCIRNTDGTTLAYKDVVQRCPLRALLSDVNLKDIRARSILGWWPTVESHLGADVNYENISWSGASEAKRSVKLSGASLGFSHIGAGTLSFAMSDRDHRLLIKREGHSSLQRIIQCATKIPVVLYDNIEKRGCLVPASDAILHLALKKLSKTRYKVNEKSVVPKFANPLRHGFDAARKCLVENLPLKLINKLEGDELGDKDYFFKDLFLEMWSYMEILSERGVEQASAPGETIKGMQDILYGWEFMDLVDDVQTLQQNQVIIEKTSGGWVNLLEDLGSVVVLLAAGLEDLIRPTLTQGLCHEWKMVPKGKDYLATGVPMLNMLYERVGPQSTRERITRKGLMLHQLSLLFEHCRKGRAFQCGCVRLQQLF